MKEYFRVSITETYKPLFSTEDYRIRDTNHETFATLDEVKTYLRERYGKAKKSKMYCDTKEGAAYHVGYIYHMREKDHDYYGITYHYTLQHWVNIEKITAENVIIKNAWY